MPESAGVWWARRQWSKSAETPYPAGTYSAFWSGFARLVDGYDPEDNAGVLLSQVPPGADVFLVWHCLLGHEWVATPEEQLARTGRGRRGGDRSCPHCSERLREAKAVVVPGRPSRRTREPPPPPPSRLKPGDAFVDPGLRLPTSAAEGLLRALLAERLEFEPGFTSIRVGGSFHGRFEVWPDVVLAELRVAIEYDTPGRVRDEHVGHREASDRRKDDLLRRVGWEVVRIRCGGLAPLGPHDLQVSGVSPRTVERLLDRIASIRGDLIVNAYRRRTAS